MAVVHHEGRSVELASGESVLDGLLRAGIDAPHSCRAGHCQTCLARVVRGDVPVGSQEGLKPTWRALGLFLTCRARPTGDLEMAAPDALGLEVGARIVDVARLSHDVVRLRLTTDAPFEHCGGQFATLVRSDGLARSYSVASLPGRDEFIEMHVRLVTNGAMSGWIARDACVGDRVALRGPAGECFHVPGRREQPLLLIGTGTGLAPLRAIVHDALRDGHTGRIQLVHGALDERGFYLVDELSALAREHANFEYARCMLRGEHLSTTPASPRTSVHVGALDARVRAAFPNLKGWRVFLCGHPELVVALRKWAFIAGAASKDIHADAFVTKPAPLPRTATS
ncbi:MAG: 2Fe-2S iron-sulfur cluster binding domain-containing protein [Planctomycetes bacterium]|nr:2Fe-2S iron-sulfur cluster binding domain-containing protein [Planctomycetota bacterium]